MAPLFLDGRCVAIHNNFGVAVFVAEPISSVIGVVQGTEISLEPTVYADVPCLPVRADIDDVHRSFLGVTNAILVLASSA